jgi:hypothetical protein
VTLVEVEIHATGNQKVDFHPCQFNLFLALPAFQRGVIQAQVNTERAPRNQTVNELAFIPAEITMLGSHATDIFYPDDDFIEEFKEP